MLDREIKKAVVEAIRRAEHRTTGEIRVHVIARCAGDAQVAAQKIFSKLGMHKTKGKNAVLIFIALNSKKFAIVGDTGIHRHVGDDFWAETCRTMAAHFSKGEIQEGILAGVEKVGAELKKYFPFKSNDKDELWDSVSEA